jgi:hypothetical protein
LKNKANQILNRLLDISDKELKYYFRFTGSKANTLEYDKRQNLSVINRISEIAEQYKDEAVSKKSKDIFNRYYQLYIQTARPGVAE